uniref:Uncharacterized protein n=1 Tax=Aegilops tauschii TaxID=37682 RepID=M8B7J7_AEGTA
MEMEMDSVQASGRRSAEELDEADPFVARKKMKHPEKGMGIGSILGRQLAEELSELLEAISLAARADRENWKGVDCVRSLRPVDMEEALAVADRKKVGKPEKGKEVASWQPTGELEEALSVAVRSGLMAEEVRKPTGELEEALSVAVRSGLMAEEVRKFLRVAAWSNLTDYDVHCLAVERGLRDEDAVSLAENFLTMYKIVFSTLHAQLLSSFDRRRFDPELCQWKTFGRFVDERKKRGPDATTFLLFKIKASARTAKVSWWRKEYPHFPPERAGYTGALRVARLVGGREGPRLEEAGEDGQPGALSYGSDYNCRWLDRRVGVLEDGWLSPLNEVAIIRRLPKGEGIYIMSYVSRLGVKLDEFLFVLHVAWTVALSFTERWFYVSSKFTEEKLYAVPGVDFLNITVLVKNLIKKLYQMYEQEEQAKKMMLEQQDPHERQEEMRPLLEEEERNKREDMRRRKEESMKQKLLRKEKREAAHQMKMVTRAGKEQGKNEEYEEDFFCTPTLLCVQNLI